MTSLQDEKTTCPENGDSEKREFKKYVERKIKTAKMKMETSQKMNVVGLAATPNAAEK